MGRPSIEHKPAEPQNQSSKCNLGGVVRDELGFFLSKFVLPHEFVNFIDVPVPAEVLLGDDVEVIELRLVRDFRLLMGRGLVGILLRLDIIP